MATPESATSDILTHHLTAFGNNDLDEIMKDYTEEGVDTRRLFERARGNPQFL
ncbi:hypothetical protein [Litoribacter populi]|uniref:hypothetical protein n=1 Tax=Litoribacter populi TaxID=2598460 RepID=UPI00163DB80C|nr:hypothetical protein [Litoribacter populi]